MSTVKHLRRRRKPTPIDHDALIARALYEASKAHLHEFAGDREVGREMRAVLADRYPDAERAFTSAAELRKALDMGFLPPPDGASPNAVRTFLTEKAKRTQVPASTSHASAPYSLHGWEDAGSPF